MPESPCAECDHAPGECLSCATQLSGGDVYRKRWERLEKLVDGMTDRVRGEFLRKLMRTIEDEVR